MRSSPIAAAAGVLLLAAATQPAVAEKKYGPGVTDTEIKIGQTMPYSGPASAYGTQGRAEAAYFKMINSTGGVNGRTINFISLDDSYSPPKTVEQTRKLVEEDNILANIGSLGTPTNSAIHKYMNAKKVPHILISTGASKWNDPKHYPWTMAFYPSYDMEAKIHAKYLLKAKPDAKIAVLYQNDDFGKDYLHGFKEGLGSKAASMIIKEVSYEVTDPTIDTQIVALKGSGADTFFDIATPKFGAQAIRKVFDIGWKPQYQIVSVASSIGGVLEPAGLEKSVGLVTAVAIKVPGDPTWDNDQAMKDYLAFMKKWYPEGNPTDASNVVGYTSGQLTVHILKACGDELTRENVLRQTSHLKDVALPMLIPGIKINTSPDNYMPYSQLQLARFDGKAWVPFGDVINANEVSSRN